MPLHTIKSCSEDAPSPTPRAPARLRLRNGNDQPIVRVFYTAYTLDGADPSRRAVTFVLQRRPGQLDDVAAHGIVRTGARARPATTVDGTAAVPASSTISTACSIAPTSSSSTCREADSAGSSAPGTREDFWGVDEDAAAFGQFIQRYITQFNRWNSPKLFVRRVVRDDAFGGSGEVSAGKGHRAQRHRSALVVSKLESRLRRRRHRSAAAIGRTCSICRPRPRPRGIITPLAASRSRRRLAEVEQLRARRSISTRWLKVRSSRPGRVQRRRRETPSLHRTLRAVHSRLEPARFRTTGSRTSCCASRGIRSDASTRVSRPTCSTGRKCRPTGMPPMRRSTGVVTTVNYYLRQVLHYNTPLLYRGEHLRSDLRRRISRGTSSTVTTFKFSTSRPIWRRR